MRMLALTGVLALLAMVPGANAQTMQPSVNPFPLALYRYPLYGSSLAPVYPPAMGWTGGKVVGKIVAIDPLTGSLRLAVSHLPLYVGTPDVVDTVTVNATPQTVLMRNGISVPLNDLSVLSVGTTIGVIGGATPNHGIQARYLGEDIVRLQPVVPAPNPYPVRFQGYQKP
jgi:hypothetical protein